MNSKKDTTGKAKILIVEDEADMRKVLFMELSTSGYEVIEAEDGEQGFQMAEKEKPDLIIADVLMPKMDGNQLLKKLRETPFGQSIPFIVLTARAKMKDYFETIEVDDFVSKPFDPEDLLQKVEKALRIPKTTATIKESSKKVLVTGDESEIVEKIASQLKGIGCEVITAATGADAITKTIQENPEVLIVDVLLEGVTAAEITKVIRELPQFAKTPILLYSFYRVSELGSEDIRQKALSVDAVQVQCREKGATEYIGRYNDTAFLKSVENFLS